MLQVFFAIRIFELSRLASIMNWGLLALVRASFASSFTCKETGKDGAEVSSFEKNFMAPVCSHPRQTLSSIGRRKEHVSDPFLREGGHVEFAA